MRQKVVVIGHGYTSRLGVIRALGREGYEVIVVVMTRYKRDRKTLNTTKPIDCYSKYVSRVLYCPSEKEKLVQLLLSECTDSRQKVVIIPDSDFSTAVVDENADRLSELFLFPHIGHKPGEIVTWMDKNRQKELATKVGLNVAKGWKIDVIDGRYTIPVDLQYPCFPKPLATLKGGKRGLKRCETEAELRAVIAILAKTNHTISILVEEFKVIDVEQALLGFTDGQEVIIPGIIKTKSLAHGGHFGVAKQGEILPVAGYEDLIEKFRVFVLRTGFVGIFDIDFYQSEGKFFFCEMNFRYGGSGYAYIAMGVNLPVMLVKTLLGENISEMQKAIHHEAVFVNERMCVDDWYSRYITTKEYKNLINNVDISFVSDEEDCGPQSRFIRMVNVIYLKRIVNRIIGRKRR